MSWIDTHTHLESFVRQGRLDEILSNARQAGVERMITIGTDPEDWGLYQTLAAGHPGVIDFTVGLHPCHVTDGWQRDLDKILPFFQTGPRPVAVGETGLDRFHLDKDPGVAEKQLALQAEAFRAQLELASRLDVPVVIHSRGAFQDCVELIDESGFDWERVVFHCFTEGPSAMEMIRGHGARGSFTGVITYKNAREVREAALAQGLEVLMLETDAPYLSPMPKRGKPNEPAYLAHTAAFVAELFGLEPDELARLTGRNARSFFGLQ